jgi:hypothetical protein
MKPSRRPSISVPTKTSEVRCSRSLNVVEGFIDHWLKPNSTLAPAGMPKMTPMSNPWLSIPLEDYEGHMGSTGVRQSTVSAELFKRALDRCLPESVGVLGVAGGNGLEQIPCTATKRTLAVDINQLYLDEVQRRFSTLAGLELHCRDLAEPGISLAPVALVHAALIFEHVGLGLALENALSLVAAGGWLSVVLQLLSEDEQGVASTKYTSMQTLKQDFSLIDRRRFQRLLMQKGFQLVSEENRSLPGGKAFWLGVFTKKQ